MDCPDCGQSFSTVIDPVSHGKRVKRQRCCSTCSYKWDTIEIDADEFTRAAHFFIERLLKKAWRDFLDVMEFDNG